MLSLLEYAKSPNYHREAGIIIGMIEKSNVMVNLADEAMGDHVEGWTKSDDSMISQRDGN